MNWKEQPNLFINDKFKIYREGHVYHIKKYWLKTKEIEVVQYQYEEYELFAIENNKTKLIARPIEDMTDEEIHNMLDISDNHDMMDYSKQKAQLAQWVSNVGLAFKDSLYLLSIGVYPFNQLHFKDGTVIDSRTI